MAAADFLLWWSKPGEESGRAKRMVELRRLQNDPQSPRRCPVAAPRHPRRGQISIDRAASSDLSRVRFLARPRVGRWATTSRKLARAARRGNTVADVAASRQHDQAISSGLWRGQPARFFFRARPRLRARFLVVPAGGLQDV
ncbi:unnamed protein product [Amoebophrya sp. A120]|nr:unnamed protein product [Amoebophrya sp. A120]|eukprot:GSA120T00001273001.1